MYTKSQINIVANILKKNETNYWTGKYIKKFAAQSTDFKAQYKLQHSSD